MVHRVVYVNITSMYKIINETGCFTHGLSFYGIQLHHIIEWPLSLSYQWQLECYSLYDYVSDES